MFIITLTMSFPVNSSSQAKPETFASMSRMDLLVAACDYMRNSVPTPGDQTPMIEENAPPVGVKAAAAILVAMHGGKFVDDADYDKLLQDEREKIAKQEHDKLVLAARWYTLFDVPDPRFHAPAIRENRPAPGVAAMAAILAVSEPEDSRRIWAQCTEDDFNYGLHVYWGDLTNVGTFDTSATLAQHANAMLENRPLTRTELILALKCDYIGKHRGWAKGLDFKFATPTHSFRRRCGTKYKPCICSSIEPNLMYDDNY